MRRRLQVLALCATGLLAARLMAQDNGAGTPLPSGGATDQSGGGTTATPGNGGLFGPGTGGASTIAPEPVPSPAAATGTTPEAEASPTPTPAGSPAANAETQGAQAAPVTLSLPGGYGGHPGKSFTLGEGRLSKPPITFSVTASQGYDDNIFSADSHMAPEPTPVPAPTPPLEERVVGFRIAPPSPPTPVFQTFRPKASATPAVTATPLLGVIGSPVTTLSLGMQVQIGTPRTVVLGDASFGGQDYWNQPGQKTDYTGNLSLSLVHRLSERATLSIDVSAVYQKSPDFSLINAPTNNGSGGNYLNGTAAINLTYQWTKRISTVTTYSLGANLLQSTASQDLYTNTIGTQFRYAVSARNTVTAELREAAGDYPSNASADTSSTFYLLGLDSILSAKLRNTISAGLQSETFANGGGSALLPYMESATTLALPRGAALTWTNWYGAQDSGAADVRITSYRTALTLTQPLSTKLVAQASLAYNYQQATDTTLAAGSSTENQLQVSLSLAYTISPRFSLSLTYSYFDLLSTAVNSSFTRDQVFLGGSYMFR